MSDSRADVLVRWIETYMVELGQTSGAVQDAVAEELLDALRELRTLV